ncbi:MAG: MlaD family protein [Alphaproteobacteria bacterium]
METKANYVLVGSFVLALFAAIIGVAIWFAKVEFDKAPMRYRVYFTGNVTGLNIGSGVRYRGVQVGSVANIAIDPENVERIRVIVEVAVGTPIKKDTIASLGVQGITGIAFIQLSGGTQASPALEPEDRRDMPVITSKRSGLETLLEKAPEIFEKTVILVDRLSRLVDDKNLNAVSVSLDNIRGITEQFGAKSGELNQLLSEGRETLAALRSVAGKTETLMSEFQASGRPLVENANDVFTDVQVTLADLRRVLQSLDSVAGEVGGIVAENRTPLRDFSEGGLYEFTQFIAESRQLVAALTRLSAQIEREPARFFFGDTQKGFEAK